MMILSRVCLIATFLICGVAPGVVRSAPAKSETKLETRLENLVRDGKFKKEEVGIWVADGETQIFSSQGDKLFIPASVSKIPTAAAVLQLLPPGHKFKTVFAANGAAANKTVVDGKLKGPIYLIGGGDPSFVSESLWFLVNELARSGIAEIEGDLVVDDSRFDDIRFGEDRQSQRVDRAYDAPLGAMSLNWNAVTAWVRPSVKSGEPAQVLLDVMSPYLKIQNKTTTKSGGANSIQVERLQSANAKTSETFLATGVIGADAPEKAIYKSIREPALWSGFAAVEFLTQRGIKLKGVVREGLAPSGVTVLAAVESKALSQIVADMMKWSNNYVADMLVKNLSAEAGDRPATTAKGIERVRSYLEKNVGFQPKAYEFINGAGFTRENRLTPKQLGSVLTSVRSDFRIFPEFLTALPIAGIDGTLKNRFQGMESIGWVRAKSGLLNGVIGLAGYAGDQHGRILTFVFIFNGAAGREDAARRLFDKMATALVTTKL